jgi:hypothetical protein
MGHGSQIDTTEVGFHRGVTATLGQSVKAPAREVLRARIVIRYYAGESAAQIARDLRTTRKSVAKWVNRVLAVGLEAALKIFIIGRESRSFAEEVRAWLVHPAGSKPKRSRRCRGTMDPKRLS